MTARSPLSMDRARSRRVALLLALCALLTTVFLTGWHEAQPHLDIASGTEYLVHPGDHHPGDQPDADDPVHVAAHIVQAVALPGGVMLAAALPVVRPQWGRRALPARPFATSTGILRPPRG